MKNQYFGDINDYKKYGLLRALSNSGEIRTGVRWMLTPSNGRTDGQKLRYLEQPDRRRQLDPDLFDHLYQCVIKDGERSVHLIENPEVLPLTSFHSQLLGDRADERQQYFAEMYELLRHVDLVFFDPDNGFEVASIPTGRRNSSKYLYWRELAQTYAAGHSVLVYQHFPRKPRTEFIRQMAERMWVETNTPSVYAFSTAGVVFLLASQPEHSSHFSRQASLISAVWKEQIQVAQPLED